MYYSLLELTYFDFILGWIVVCGLNSFGLALLPSTLLWSFFVFRIFRNRSRIKHILEDILNTKQVEAMIARSKEDGTV